MVKYRCTVCKFRFQSAILPKKCPYCSREGTVLIEESAADLLEDIDRILE